ncbi:Oidioi.mRNA.OKI2018_I69.PAR.g9500.t1.cds [Oikopleura dioica]|uniref:Oidioi.mRNA.OKI2018_I69.PAR.g9500.t1.cds n=1 Tax=Oikopleura dioica TaxID=34765 RepID=A0ABN7RRE9_OIKDI|nr:Oidioi.mRNA.OKI2018_I69.PAR.g9500.t1.cds [Oikopleura dioica]
MRKTLFLLYFWSFCEAQGRFSPRRINAGGFFHPKRGVKTEKRTWPRISIRLLKSQILQYHTWQRPSNGKSTRPAPWDRAALHSSTC